MNKLLKISLVVFISSLMLQITVCNHMAVKTRELNQIASQIIDLQNQISVVSQDIYVASAIASMEQKALSQGFLLTQVPVNHITNPTIARSF